MIVGPLNSGAAAGTAGSATANTDHGLVRGGIYGIYVKYNDSPPAATTDVVISTTGDNAPSYDILTLTNAATDGLFLPRTVAHDLTGTAQTTYNEIMPVHDGINVKIAGANSGDSVDVYLYVTEAGGRV